jgi:hypothetical protein
VAPPATVGTPPLTAAPPTPQVRQKKMSAAAQKMDAQLQAAQASQRPAGAMRAAQPPGKRTHLGVEPLGAHLSRAELETAAKLSKNNGIVLWGVALVGVIVMFLTHMIFTQKEMVKGPLHVALILVELTWTSIWGFFAMRHLNRAHLLESELKERKKKRRI